MSLTCNSEHCHTSIVLMSCHFTIHFNTGHFNRFQNIFLSHPPWPYNWGQGGELVIEPKTSIRILSNFLTLLSEDLTPRSPDADDLHSRLPSRTFRDFPPIIEKARFWLLIWDANACPWWCANWQGSFDTTLLDVWFQWNRSEVDQRPEVKFLWGQGF